MSLTDSGRNTRTHPQAHRGNSRHPARVPAPRSGKVRTGRVKWFDKGKGYGFIAPEDGGKDVHVHRTAVDALRLKSLDTGQRLEFTEGPGMKGQNTAFNLKLLS